MRDFTPSLWVFAFLFALGCSTAVFAQTPSPAEPAVVQLDARQVRQVFTALSNMQEVQFDNMIVGEKYSIIVPNDPALAGCLPTIHSNDLSAATVESYDADAHMLTLVAKATTVRLRLDYPCTYNPASPPRHYITVQCLSCMKQSLRDYMEALQKADGPLESLSVESGNVEELIKEVLIGGNCFDVTGVTLSGNGGQIGTFGGGLTNIGFSTGIIMATGGIGVAPGPNDSDGASAGYGASTPDPDLEALSGGASIFDRCMIEFDFTPTQTPVTFEFVFASEEYCEYVGSQFNDVFGFFVSGPGISGPFGGAANIAVVPNNPGVYVAINSINHLSNSGYYVNNQPNSSSNLCGQNPSFGVATNELQYDGFTRKMIAVANVQPCQTYHIALKVADVGDGVWDSAVFLKAGSFDAGGNASVDFQVNGNTDVSETYESCGLVELVFDRVGSNPSTPLPVTYTITGTAKAGVDYVALPSSVVIPAGQDKLVIPVNILNDNLLEGDEDIIITLNNPCSCLKPEEILIIKDLPKLEAEVDSAVVCGSGTGVLSVNVTNGVDPYTYLWSNGSTDSQTAAFVAGTTQYKVTVTDACGNTLVKNTQIKVNQPPKANFLPTSPQLCEGGSVPLIVKLTGKGPFTLEYDLNGDPQPAHYNITTEYDTIWATEVGSYVITGVTDEGGCTGPGTGLSILVTPSNLSLTGVVTDINCAGQTAGSINTTVTGSKGPYAYDWTSTGTNVPKNVADPANLAAGTYKVTVTDGWGCPKEATFIVKEPDPVIPSIVNVQGTNCTSPSGGSINLSITGGTPTYTFQWSNGATNQSPTNLTPGNYSVTVTDSRGCTKTASASVPNDNTPPAAVVQTPGLLDCQNTTVTLDGTGSSTGSNISYQWTASGGGKIQSGATNINPVVSAAGTYTLLVKNNTNGCTATATTTVATTAALPLAEAGTNLKLTCVLTTGTLNAAGSSTGNEYTYQWTASNGGNIVAGDKTLTPEINAAGTYTLVVTNNNNKCTSTDQVVVSKDVDPPVAVVSPPGLLTCATSTVTLNGQASTPAGSIGYLWTTVDGAFASSPASPTVVVTEPGEYILVVTNTTNGCTSTKSASVGQDYSDPSASVTSNGLLNCATTQLSLNGTASSNSTYTFEWLVPPGGNIVSGQNSLSPIVDKPGNYTLVVTNTISQCTTAASILINQDVNKPPVEPGLPGMLTCSLTQIMLGDSTAATGPNISYTWTATNGGAVPVGANTPNPTISQPGTYQLVVNNNSNGCSSTASVVIGQNITKPTVVVAPGGELNCTSPTLMLNGSGTSTGANFKYEWSSSTGGGIGSGGNSLSPVVTAAGTYTLLVTNTQNGCTSQAATSVTTNANLPKAIAVPSGILNCTVKEVTLNSNGSTTGNNIAYQWATVNGLIVNGQNAANATAGAPGLYTLIVSNKSNNCTATFAVEVEQDVTPPIADAGPAKTLNCTQPSLSIDGSASSAGPNFTYNWTTTNGNFVSGTDIASPQVNEAGLYTLLVTNISNGCTSSDDVQIVRDANDPVVSIAAPSILNCKTQQIPLDAAGSTTGPQITYQWTPKMGGNIVSGGTTLNPIVDKPGDYVLEITNEANGCKSDLAVNVKQDIVAPVAEAGPDGIVNCTNTLQQLGGPGTSTGSQYTYTWTGGTLASGTGSATPTVNQGGTYTLVVTNNDNGCTASDNVTVAFDQTKPSANAGTGSELTCTQKEFTLNATASQGANFSYSWTTTTGNFTTPTNLLNPTVNGAGQYTLVVTDATNGCTATSSVAITQSADVPVALAAQPAQLTCAVTSITLDASKSSNGTKYAYEWKPENGGNIVSGSTTLNPVIDKPGTYVLTVLDQSNNCTSFTSVLVNGDFAAPPIEAGADQTLTCSLPTVSLAAKMTKPGNYTYQWNGAGIVSGGNTLTPVVNALGNYSITVTNTDNGCTATDGVEVLADLNAPITAIAPADTLDCKKIKVTLDATASSTGNMTYVWKDPAGALIQTADSLKVTVDKPGLYSLLITNKDNGCKTADSVLVAQDIVLPKADAGANGKLTCAVTSIVLDGNQSSQTGNYFYQWTADNGGSILSGANTLTPTVAQGGRYVLAVLNEDNGCSATDEVLVSVDKQLPAVVIPTPDILSCKLTNVTLKSTGSQQGPIFEYSWATLDGHFIGGQTGTTATVDKPGTYFLTVLNTSNGCSSEEKTIVSLNNEPPSADAGPAATLTCTVTQVQLNGAAPAGTLFSYSWSTPNGKIVSGANSLNPVVNQEGSYLLLVTNTENGCKTLDTVAIIKEKNVPIDFTALTKRPSCLNNDGSIEFDTIISGVGPFQYSIDNGVTYKPSAEFNSLKPGTYKLLIVDANGCKLNETVAIPEAPPVSVNLIPEIKLQLGDTAQLVAALPATFPLALIEQVIWSPLDSLTFKSNKVADLLRPVAKPIKPTEYTVTVITFDKCQASDRVLIRVDDEPAVYIPNVFAPDSESGNNKVNVFGKEGQVRMVRKFAIYDRWGEMVFQDYNFAPNDPKRGWDGQHNGQVMAPAVFVYLAEVELIDGRVLLYKGDVTLVR